MGTHVTTNVRMPAEMLKALKRRALEEGTSVADLVRASVASYLVHDDGQAVDYESDPFFALGREPGDGPSDGSENHDRYIYTPAGAKPA